MATKTIKLQKLVVHTHNDKKLFHVSMHNVDTTTGTNWTTVAGKAKYSYELLLNGKRNESNERALTGGLVIAMVNTNYEGWETANYEGQYDIDEAISVKYDLIDQYEEVGYKNVGVRSIISKRDPSNDGNVPASWSRTFNVSTMNKKKIDQKIEFINTSLQLNIPASVKTAAYLEVVRQHTSKIDNMATLLYYVRNKMGVN